jgi:2-oxoglutarate ferredoxin oxidoreductase subunit alpha
MSDITIRVAGANGDGVESSGDLISKFFLKQGYQIFAYRSYQSIIRGGHVWYQVRVADQELHSHGDKINILIAINQDAIENQASHLADGAVVIYDASKTNVEKLKGMNVRAFDVPMLDAAVKNGGDPILRNVVAIGAMLKVTGQDIAAFENTIKERFGKKGDVVVKNNTNAAVAGFGQKGVETLFSIKADGKRRYLMDGNSALAAGAFAGGCRFYAAYPMTPASTILQWFAANAGSGILAKQTEDEIAAINVAIGAASAGARAMCGTSGGGFSLMVEALGLSGMIEVPLVVVDSQRGGPSTGLPTKTEQGDLLFAMHAGQGEFPRIVMAPRTTQECFSMGAQSFNLAERYQCPVIILVDLYLSEYLKSVDSFDVEGVTVDRGKIAVAPTDGKFKRYVVTDDGISPRAFAGMPGTEFVASSDDHDEDGVTITDYYAGLDWAVAVRKKIHEKRMRKVETMLKQEKIFVPEVEGEGSDYFMVTFGSTMESVIEARGLLEQKGIKAGIVSFPYIMPMDGQKTLALLKGKRLIDIECNYTSQLAQVIRMNTGIEIKNKITKYDGEAITGGEIAESVAEIIKNAKEW